MTVIQSKFVRGKNKILTCGADLFPIPINDSSEASENPDLQNDVSKIPHASLFHLQHLLNLCVGLLCANNPLYQAYLYKKTNLEMVTLL